MGGIGLPTIYDVAKKAGVSTATVSRVINGTGRVSDATRQRVMAVIAALGYQPNDIARTLTTKQSKMIGLVISDITNPFYPAVARGVQDVCHAAGYNVLLCNTDEKPRLVKQYVLSLCQKQVDGIILQAFVPEDLEMLNVIQKAGIETILISYPDDVRVTAVYTNDTEGAYLATRHLIDIGHERIAFFGGPITSSITRRRFDGYQRALQEASINLVDRYVFYGNFNQAGGDQMAHQFLETSPRPTAIFAANDLIALGAMQLFEQVGIAIPKDVAVVGFDDIDAARLVRPRLTTIANPRYELGQIAAQLLFSRLKDPKQPHRHIILDTRLVLRDSSLIRREQKLT